MAKIIIYGATGGLGTKVSEILSESHEVISLSSKSGNLFDKQQMLIQVMAKPDVIISFAGTNKDGFLHKPQDTQSASVAMGHLNIFENYLPGMRERKRGSIIFISSILSELNIVGTGIYAASKAFIDKIVQVAALENSSKGIQINSIRLGYFDGGMTYQVPNIESVIETIPMQRLGAIQELINTIEFIISTPYMTGTNLKLSGGL